MRWPDGRDAVVTTALVSMDRMRQTAEVLAGVKALGLPVSEHQFLFQLDDGTVAVVQERLPGSSVVVAEIATVDAIISGVIDWNYGVARGDRHYGLVKLLHTLSFDAASPDVGHHPSLAAVRRVNRFVAGNESAVDTYIELGESRLA